MAKVIFAVVRYNPDGSLDGSFGSLGKAITPVGTGDVVDQSYALALQPDGKIVVVGTSLILGSQNSYDMALVRYNVNGSLDLGFGSGGKIIVPAEGYSIASDVVLQPDGKIVVVAGGGRFAVGQTEIVRFNPNGSLDTNFAANGSFTTDGSFFSGRGIALQPDGKIVAFGEGRIAANSFFAFAAMSLNPNGSPDAGFGTDGRVLTPIDTIGSGATAGALQSDGKPLAFGIVRTGADWANDIVIIRYLSNSAVSVTGRVLTPDGRGLRNATVTLTDSLGVRRTTTTSSFGFYTFDDVRAGDTYVIGVNSRLYRFTSRILRSNDTLTDVDFVDFAGEE